jgi:copper resistance protein B
MTRSLTRYALALAILVLMAPPSSWAQTGGHSGHQQEPTQTPQKPAAGGEHDHHAPGAEKPELPPFIPALTDADRKAAFPDVKGHAVHDHAINSSCCSISSNGSRAVVRAA